MFYKIVMRDAVHNDIFNLTEYIYRFSLSKQIANKVYNDLYSAIFSLNFLPNRFEKSIWEYRRLIVDWNYKIFYRVDEENKKVIIIRVLRSEQNNF